MEKKESGFVQLTLVFAIEKPVKLSAVDDDTSDLLILHTLEIKT